MYPARIVGYQIFVMASIIVLGGCANPVNQRTAMNYFEWGLKAEAARDYPLAERNYYRALVNAQVGHSPDEGVSAAMYKLGTMKAHLCKYEEAEKLLLESLALQEKATGPENEETAVRLFVLGTFYSNHKQYESSLPYYQRFFSIVKKLGLETRDPIAISNALKEYSYALEKAGHEAEAKNVREEAEELRRNNPGKKTDAVIPRYNCPPPRATRAETTREGGD
jgi:tetratricopeptide (TPR) repeat protein